MPDEELEQIARPAAFRRLCVETLEILIPQAANHPAAFRRLCVETHINKNEPRDSVQPPSGGCVLKHQLRLYLQPAGIQPPSGGCVLKRVVVMDK